MGKAIFSYTLTGDKNTQLENVHSVGVTFLVLLAGSHTGGHPRHSALWLSDFCDHVKTTSTTNKRGSEDL